MKTLRELQGQRSVTLKQLEKIKEKVFEDLVIAGKLNLASKISYMTLKEFARYTGRTIKS